MSSESIVKKKKKKTSSLLSEIARDRNLYLMLIPGLLYFAIFKYLPMFGVMVAFQNYMPFLGFLKSDWVGMANFQRFFGDPAFFGLLKNTIILAVYNIIFYFPLPIIIALLLNELFNERFKRIVQSIIYVPHFISWVVIAGICYSVLSVDNGVVNALIKACGGDPINFLASSKWFRPLIILQLIWKDTGWGTIIFLAALAGVNVELYEAAVMDGANRWQQFLAVTFPAIKSTVVIMLILRMGTFMDSGFEQIFLMLNSMNRSVGEVFDTYVYTSGMLNGQFSYSTAVGLFKSLVSLMMVLTTNYIAKKAGEEGIY
jgi:putative aldouronate transport system permease protein